MKRLVILILLSVSLPSFASAHTQLKGLHVKATPTFTQVNFLLTNKTFGRLKYLPHPDRVIIRLENTEQHLVMPSRIILKNANVKSWQAQNLPNNILQFTFLLNNPITPSIRFISNAGKLTNLQLELKTIVVDSALIQKHHALKNIFAADLQQFAKKKMAQSKVQIAAKNKAFIIVIDAGHGGKDTGAIGVNKSREKNIVLSIAKKLAAEINSNPNLKAIMTRYDDRFVPLQERLKFARKGKADLFVAIHADAYFNSTAKGVSVYALSEHGASSVAARWLAQNQNHTELGDVALNDLQDQSPILRSVLIDLAQTVTIRDSIFLGNRILDALDHIAHLHYTHVERAPFLVLKSPDIPSVLIETGFLSNLNEEKRLRNPRYQTKIAHAIRMGIDDFIQQYLSKHN